MMFFARHVRAVARPGLQDPLGELLLEGLVVLAAGVRLERHHVPRVGGVLAGRRLGRVDQAQRTRAELHQRGHAAGLHIAVRGEQVRHRVGADAPFERAIDVRIERLRGEARALVQGQMQAEQRPGGVLEAIEPRLQRLRQLLAADQALERLVHVDGAGDELPGPHDAAVVERDPGRASALDHDAIDPHLRRNRCRRPR